MNTISNEHLLQCEVIVKTKLLYSASLVIVLKVPGTRIETLEMGPFWIFVWLAGDMPRKIEKLSM